MLRSLVGSEMCIRDSRILTNAVVPPAHLLGTLAVILEGSKGMTIPLVNEPRANLWELGMRLFQAAEAAPFEHLAESAIENRIARTEALLSAVVSICSSCADTEGRQEQAKARKAWVRPPSLSPLEEREHFEGSIFEAGFAVHERMNTLLTRDLRMYMEATYGTQSIESGLVAKALLDYSGPCTIRSWQHALELLGMVSGQLPAFSGQMSAARRGVRSYLVLSLIHI
eukprot:TRINITY_DN26262_c0_g1_i1.p1 TRINITY_DN26262_c0_g1~~TRINITY_DN26262_c0_g1_i1.p1  ORF type:complete len:227 (+),score=38.46 TRINITY_DN26262_c0_g1_i1:121-801(+)